MAENNQKIKLLKIMEFLRAESSENKPVSTSQMINYLNSIHISCERRTLYKDMDMLIESGANIIKTELGRENAYYIDEISFSLAELKLLIDAVQAANFITADKTAELTNKLL
ncbi:MAG: WYL domain-containing protein, partial [Oscillospiraceae bacterium]|nr:WYL domain-containing protein [Oscillospiraceae bacterium]